MKFTTEWIWSSIINRRLFLLRILMCLYLRWFDHYQIKVFNFRSFKYFNKPDFNLDLNIQCFHAVYFMKKKRNEWIFVFLFLSHGSNFKDILISFSHSINPKWAWNQRQAMASTLCWARLTYCWRVSSEPTQSTRPTPIMFVKNRLILICSLIICTRI